MKPDRRAILLGTCFERVRMKWSSLWRVGLDRSATSLVARFPLYLLAAMFVLQPQLLFQPTHADDAPKSTKHSDYTQSVLVEVPVSVTRGGEPVRGLTADDFKLLDRGSAVDIVGLSVMDLQTTSSAPTALPPAGMSMAARRHFLLLFDMSNSHAKAIARARSAVGEWLEYGLHPWDLVGVATYSRKTGARLLLNFTSDFEQVGLAVDSLGIPQFVETTNDPLALEIGLPGTNRAVGVEFGLRPPRSAGADVIASDRYESALEDIYFGVYEKMMVAEQRHQVTDFTESLSVLVEAIKSRRGRKHVLLFSEGIDRDLIFASADPNEIARMNHELQFGRLEVVDSSRRFGNTTALSQMKELTRAFQRADCTVQSVQIGGVGENSTRGANDPGIDSLFALSNGTGGEVFRNFNRIDESLNKVVDRTSVTYVLSFYPKELRNDGSFNRLKVKLKQQPRGTRITHRPGYFEPKPYSETSDVERRAQAAERIMEGVDAGPLDASLLAVPFHRGNSPAYVPFLIEVPGSALPLAADGALHAIEIYAYAIDSAGSIHDFLSQQLNTEDRAAADSLRQSGVKFFGDFELPPGSYTLRVLVRETDQGLWASRVAEFKIADAAATPTVLLPPLFPDARGQWMLARESALETDTPANVFPFMFEQQPFLPAARPRVSTSGSSRILLAGYEFGTGPQVAEAQLYDMAGAKVEGATITLFKRETDPRMKHEFLAGELSMNKIAAGDYTLAVTVGSGAPSLARTSSLPIRVITNERRADATDAP